MVRGTSNRATVRSASPRAPERIVVEMNLQHAPGEDLHQVLTVRGDLVVHIQDLPDCESAMREAGIEEAQAALEREPVPRAAAGLGQTIPALPVRTPWPQSPTTATGSASRYPLRRRLGLSCSGTKRCSICGGGDQSWRERGLARPPDPLGRRVVHRRHRKPSSPWKRSTKMTSSGRAGYSTPRRAAVYRRPTLARASSPTPRPRRQPS